MIDVDKFLEAKGLSYEKLTPVERETYHQMITALERSEVTLPKLKDAIHEMKTAVEEKLIDTPEFRFLIIPNREHVYLKARLKNYIAIENILLTPERAEKAVEQQMGAMTGR